MIVSQPPLESFSVGKATVICADSESYLQSQDDSSFDAVLTSVPFKNEDLGFSSDDEWHDWFRFQVRNLKRVTRDYVLIFAPRSRLVRICADTRPDYVWSWVKAPCMYKVKINDVHIYRGQSPRYNIIKPAWSDVFWEHGEDSYSGFGIQAPPILTKTSHPYEDPEDVYRHLLRILKMGNSDSLVLDPYAGLATTSKACNKLGLRSVSIEIDHTRYLSAQKNLMSASRRLSEVFGKHDAPKIPVPKSKKK